MTDEARERTYTFQCEPEQAEALIEAAKALPRYAVDVIAQPGEVFYPTTPAPRSAVVSEGYVAVTITDRQPASDGAAPLWRAVGGL